jgi:serine/threonine protein kinase/Tfp pilus assembly protein PilF
MTELRASAERPAADTGPAEPTRLPAAGRTDVVARPGPARPPPDTHRGEVPTVVGPATRAAAEAGAPPAAGWPSVPGYQILGELGRGSMGVVYRARQLGLARRVALKMVRTGAAASDQALDRFVEEARVVASLQHPNIVQIYDINPRPDAPYFSMELVEGGTLADRLGGRPQPFRQAARLVETVARAIHVAHEQGIVHRDLKPANILIAAPGPAPSRFEAFGSGGSAPAADPGAWVPKITDFGLAKQLQGGTGQTESGMIMGTPSYMAPEQAEGRSRDVGPTADVYALGAILYEMLTGRPPFTAESPMETVLLLFQTEPVSPSRLQPKVPRDLETICLKCLQKEPRRRYASAEAVAEDLRRFLAGETIAARPVSLPEQAWKWAKRRPALATLAAGLCVAVLGLAGLAAWHQAELRARLAQARLDERAARAAQEAVAERARLAALDDKVKDRLRAGEGAAARKDWHGARLELLRARDLAAAEPGLADLRERIDGLLAEAERRRRDRERFQEFVRRRNDALFNATLFTGGDLVSTLGETRSAALEALALFGVTPDAEAAPAVDSPELGDGEKAEVRAACYELLLVLAEAVAQPLPGQAADEQRRQAGQALHLLDRAARLGPPTRAWYLRRAHYLAQAGDPSAARREHERAQAVQPAGVLDYFLLGDEQYRQGNWPQAVVAFENVLQRQPDHFWGQYYLALCWLKTHRPDLAAARLTACLGWRPDFPWLYLLRGSAWGELGQFARAEEDFRAALQGPLPDSARYGLYVDRGVLRIRQGRVDEALDDLRQAVRLKPGQYQGYVNLAQAYLKGERPEEALAQLDEAVRREPGLAALYRTRAHVRLLRHDPAALADLEEAIRLEAGHPSTALAEDHVERGRLLLARGDREAAVRACEAALAVLPRSVRAHRLRAEALLELERLPEALEALDACLRHGPPDAELFRARAGVRTRLGQYPGAQADYTRALELAPDAASYAGRGWTYLVAEAPQLALADFEEAVRLDPGRGEAYAGRGHARAMLGRYRLAVADAEEAVRHGPASPRLLYNAARVYAVAVARLETDPGREARAAAHLGPRWQERGVQLLRQALDGQAPGDGVRFWRTVIRADATLNALRRTAGFRQLAERYGQWAG